MGLILTHKQEIYVIKANTLSNKLTEVRGILKQGIYEEIINQKLKKNLQDLSLEAFDIGKEKIDVEEARKLLSSYISQVTRRALNYVRDNYNDDNEAILNQIRTCNDIISTLHKNLDDDDEWM
ncbi:hypothetical protein HYG86_14430 [Alkalicella caledoniensis]|uniref:Uncharacterized protein n=1 Tax=Alkalicella caledoniensis TaxID=2731377 RepID=A0A7G9WB17_ALKCA|nr:hypothetical protein [Alkalicella caledoniensis]QNO15879.1 hypothetical protein HYG86_14430 [Alkalicella caledoniensis]